MVRKEDVEFYCRFSRKELQCLCKKYNLPANRTSLDMAESLASYFEKNSLNSVGFGVAGNQDNSATTSRAPAKRMRKLEEKGPPTNSKSMDSRLVNRMREVASGDSPSSSSFEFHVSLEEGISLSVDLNFNRSDWINSMRNEVNVCDSMHRRKSSGSDLGINNATECKKQKKSGLDTDGNHWRESSISPAMKDNTQLPSDHHSNGERSLASSAIEPCSRIKKSSDSCKDINGLNLSIPDSSGPVQIISSCVESYSKSCCVNPVDVDCVIPPGKKLTSDPVMVAAKQIYPAANLLIEIPENPSIESFQKIGNSCTVICPPGAGSEQSSSEAEAYHSNPPCSPHKTSRSSIISSPEIIIARKFASYSEPFKFQCNGGKNCLPPNTGEQEMSEVLSEQAQSE